jgi:hypothetical protein
VHREVITQSFRYSVRHGGGGFANHRGGTESLPSTSDCQPTT